MRRREVRSDLGNKGDRLFMSDIYVRFVSGKYFLGDEKQTEQAFVCISLQQ